MRTIFRGIRAGVVIVLCVGALVVVIYITAQRRPFHSPHTPMQHGSATYNPAFDQLIAALRNGGWSLDEINPDEHPNGDRYVIAVMQQVGDHICKVWMRFYPPDTKDGKPTYQVYGVGGRLLIEWPKLVPHEFGKPGIGRDELRERLANALKTGAITCPA